MRVFSIVMLSLLLMSCGGQASDEQSAPVAEPTSEMNNEPTTAESTETAAITVASAVRPVACGCAIEGVGKCGNYVMIDGKHVEIANASELGLGAMQWCGTSGVMAQTAGQIVDGRLVATEVAVVAE